MAEALASHRPSLVLFLFLRSRPCTLQRLTSDSGQIARMTYAGIRAHDPKRSGLRQRASVIESRTGLARGMPCLGLDDRRIARAAARASRRATTLILQKQRKPGPDAANETSTASGSAFRRAAPGDLEETRAQRGRRRPRFADCHSRREQGRRRTVGGDELTTPITPEMIQKLFGVQSASLESGDRSENPLFLWRRASKLASCLRRRARETLPCRHGRRRGFGAGDEPDANRAFFSRPQAGTGTQAKAADGSSCGEETPVERLQVHLTCNSKSGGGLRRHRAGRQAGSFAVIARRAPRNFGRPRR